MASNKATRESAPEVGTVDTLQEQPKANLPVPAAPAPSGVAVAAPNPGGVQPISLFGGAEDMRLQVFTSIPLENKSQLLSLIQGQAQKLGDKIGEVIAAEHVLVHRVEVITEDGEAMDADRIVIVAADGAAYAGTSIGIRRSLQYIMALYGVPPWRPNLNLKIGQLNTRRGFRTYTLTPVA